MQATARLVTAGSEPSREESSIFEWWGSSRRYQWSTIVSANQASLTSCHNSIVDLG